MDCQSNLKDLLGEYIKNELSEEKATEVRRHLAECLECASDAAQIETLLRGMAALAEEHIQPEALLAYVDSGSRKPEFDDIEDHFAICDQCQSEVDRLKKLETESGKAAPATVEDIFKFRKKFIRILLPAAAVLFLLFLFFKGFRLEFSTEQTAKAENNSLAIMYFENLTDPGDRDRTAEMVTSLLITDLSESQYMHVVSQQRLYDILKLLGKEGLKVINKQVAAEVAKKAQAKWILTGKVLQTRPYLVVTAEVSEAEDGKILASQRTLGSTEEDIFAVVDKLSNKVKVSLSLSGQAKGEISRPVAEITTHSPEAYRYYLEGIDYRGKLYFPESEISFKKALQFDSTFALAYHGLAVLGGPETEKLMALAVKYSNKASEQERLHIKTEAALIAGNYDEVIRISKILAKRYPTDKQTFIRLAIVNSDYRYKPEEAISNYLKVLELDPLNAGAYKGLGYCYDQIGDFEKSVIAIDKYLSLVPNEPDPYDCKADIYAHNGKLDEAIDLYKTTLKKNPAFYATLPKLGHSYLFKKDYFRAESCYKELASCNDKDYRSQGRLFLAYIPLFQGKFTKALAILNQGTAADEMEQVETWPKAFKYLTKAGIYEQQGNFKRAAEEAGKSVKHFPRTWGNYFTFFKELYIALLAKNGDITTAESMAEALKKDVQKSDSTQMWRYWFVKGNIEMAKNRPDAALLNLAKIPNEVPFFFVHFYLAKAYLENGKLVQAVAQLERLTPFAPVNFNQFLLTPEVMKSNYLLGLAYEKIGRFKDAVEKYEEFLDIWKNANPGIPEIIDAKVRLERLKMKA